MLLVHLVLINIRQTHSFTTSSFKLHYIDTAVDNADSYSSASSSEIRVYSGNSLFINEFITWSIRKHNNYRKTDDQFLTNLYVVCNVLRKAIDDVEKSIDNFYIHLLLAVNDRQIQNKYERYYKRRWNTLTYLLTYLLYGPGRRSFAYLLYYTPTVSPTCAIFITTLHRSGYRSTMRGAAPAAARCATRTAPALYCAASRAFN